MKKSKCTETQILKIVHQAESGRAISDICRDHGIGQQTFYNWRKNMQVCSTINYAGSRNWNLNWHNSS